MHKSRSKGLTIFSTIFMIIAFFVTATNVQGLNMKAKVHSKIENVVMQLQEEYVKGPTAVQKFVHERDIKTKDYDKVTVFLISETEGTTDVIDKALLQSYGAEIIKGAGNVLKVNIPINAVNQIADNVKGISFIRLPDKPIPLAVSEGVNLTGASAYHSAGYTGSAFIISG